MTIASDAVTLRVMEIATYALSNAAFEINDAEPEVADGLLQLSFNCDEQATQLRRDEKAYAGNK